MRDHRRNGMSLDLAPGALFAGDYRIVRPLSAGGMGAVYVVDQISTAKQRALKLMHPQLVADAGLRRRFEQEARIGARIHSEHVVEVQAAGVDAATGTPYLVMELLDGADLAATVQSRGALPKEEVAEIFEQLCHAMAAAHDAGIVHRDLKPENVFLARSKRARVPFTVKVLDFGIAKLVAEGAGTSTSAVGTPLWLAPEQTDRRPIGPQADVWALGLIAFHLLCGFPFWRAAEDATPSITQVLREILIEPIAPASVRASERGVALPIGFDAWFQRCVVREPSARFADAREVLAALAPVLASPLAAVVTTGPMPSGPARAAFTVAPTQLPYAVTPPPVAAPPPKPLPAWLLIGAILGGAVVLGVLIAAARLLEDAPPRPRAASAATAPSGSSSVIDAAAEPAVSALTSAVASASASASPSASAGSRDASVTHGATSVNGRLPPEVIGRIVRASSGRIRACYEKTLAKDSFAKGTVEVTFVIGRSGEVTSASSKAGKLPAELGACISSVFQTMTFPAPEGGTVTVVYPIDLAPG